MVNNSPAGDGVERHVVSVFHTRDFGAAPENFSAETDVPAYIQHVSQDRRPVVHAPAVDELLEHCGWIDP